LRVNVNERYTQFGRPDLLILSPCRLHEYIRRVSRKRAPLNVVEAAIELAGGISVVARELNVSRPTIYRWIARGSMREAPYYCVLVLSKMTGIRADKLTAQITNPVKK
jgi:hypothetical protein